LEEVIYQSTRLKYKPAAKPAEAGGKANLFLGFNFDREEVGDV
jgi:hypothetical protein